MPYWLSHQFWVHDHSFYFILLCLVGCILGWITGGAINARRRKK